MRLSLAFFRGPHGWPYLLAPLIPIAVALELAGSPATVVFAASALGIVPTAALMGRATEELAARSGQAPEPRGVIRSIREVR